MCHGEDKPMVRSENLALKNAVNAREPFGNFEGGSLGCGDD
ncbi:hypothetical protein EBESD8_34530 [Rhodococcus aetherivorans]|nr:hypothetical protein EBESD8_34530 [Rhodococcus aetherivorans]